MSTSNTCVSVDAVINTSNTENVNEYTMIKV